MTNEIPIIINTCFGGFNLSDEIKQLYTEKNRNFGILSIGYTTHMLFDLNMNKCLADEDFRTDPDMIDLVIAMDCEKASGPHSQLKIVRIPADVEYTIEEYDGKETIREVSRSWS